MTNYIQLLLLISLAILLCYWIYSNPDDQNFIKKIFITKSKILIPLRIIELFLFFETIFPSFFYTNRIDNLIVRYVGICMVYLGLFFAVWAKYTMKKSWGVPAQHDKIKQANLIVTGPFKISRNPIYVGLIAMAFGFQLALSSWMIFSIPFVIGYVYRVIQIEEILLLKLFGTQYEKYTKKVRKFL